MFVQTVSFVALLWLFLFQKVQSAPEEINITGEPAPDDIITQDAAINDSDLGLTYYHDKDKNQFYETTNAMKKYVFHEKSFNTTTFEKQINSTGAVQVLQILDNRYFRVLNLSANNSKAVVEPTELHPGKDATFQCVSADHYNGTFYVLCLKSDEYLIFEFKGEDYDKKEYKFNAKDASSKLHPEMASMKVGKINSTNPEAVLFNRISLNKSENVASLGSKKGDSKYVYLVELDTPGSAKLSLIKLAEITMENATSTKFAVDHIFDIHPQTDFINVIYKNSTLYASLFNISGNAGNRVANFFKKAVAIPTFDASKSNVAYIQFSQDGRFLMGSANNKSAFFSTILANKSGSETDNHFWYPLHNEWKNPYQFQECFKQGSNRTCSMLFETKVKLLNTSNGTSVQMVQFTEGNTDSLISTVFQRGVPSLMGCGLKLESKNACFACDRLECNLFLYEAGGYRRDKKRDELVLFAKYLKVGTNNTIKTHASEKSGTDGFNSTEVHVRCAVKSPFETISGPSFSYKAAWISDKFMPVMLDKSTGFKGKGLKFEISGTNIESIIKHSNEVALEFRGPSKDEKTEYLLFGEHVFTLGRTKASLRSWRCKESFSGQSTKIKSECVFLNEISSIPYDSEVLSAVKIASGEIGFLFRKPANSKVMFVVFREGKELYGQEIDFLSHGGRIVEHGSSSYIFLYNNQDKASDVKLFGVEPKGVIKEIAANNTKKEIKTITSVARMASSNLLEVTVYHEDAKMFGIQDLTIDPSEKTIIVRRNRTLWRPSIESEKPEIKMCSTASDLGLFWNPKKPAMLDIFMVNLTSHWTSFGLGLRAMKFKEIHHVDCHHKQSTFILIGKLESNKTAVATYHGGDLATAKNPESRQKDYFEMEEGLTKFVTHYDSTDKAWYISGAKGASGFGWKFHTGTPKVYVKAKEPGNAKAKLVFKNPAKSSSIDIDFISEKLVQNVNFQHKTLKKDVLLEPEKKYHVNNLIEIKGHVMSTVLEGSKPEINYFTLRERIVFSNELEDSARLLQGTESYQTSVNHQYGRNPIRLLAETSSVPMDLKVRNDLAIVEVVQRDGAGTSKETEFLIYNQTNKYENRYKVPTDPSRTVNVWDFQGSSSEGVSILMATTANTLELVEMPIDKLNNSKKVRKVTSFPTTRSSVLRLAVGRQDGKKSFVASSLKTAGDWFLIFSLTAQDSTTLKPTVLYKVNNSKLF